MPRKKKLPELKQLDITAAFYGKDVFIEEKTEDVDVEKKAITPWDFVNDIRKFKKGNLLDDERNVSAWNNFMVIKCLASKIPDVFILNYFNEKTSTLSKDQMYLSLLHVIPKDSGFYPYAKSKVEEQSDYIDFVSRYYECSKNEAFEYIKMMGDDWAMKVKEKFGDLI